MANIVLITALLALLTGCESQTATTTEPKESTTPTIIASTTETLSTHIERCAHCHGQDGNLGRNNAPYIGGQQPEYLAFATRAYINGLRRRPHEQAMTIHLSHAQIEALAQHYAQQERQWPQESPAIAHSNERGKQLAHSCAACHGDQGISQRPGIPNLAGLDPDYFVKAVTSYIRGDRKSELMQVYKSTLKEDDIDTLASYYNHLNGKRSGNNPEPSATITSLAQRCAACHGAQGRGAVDGIPHLAGQNSDYLVHAITAYRDGQRKEPMMNQAATGLNTRQISALANYFAEQEHIPIPFGQLQFGSTHDPVADGALIAASCNGCHHNPQGVTPNLNGLAPSYLQMALKSYKNGERPHPGMRRFSQHLNNLDIEKVALYYATQPSPTASHANAEQPGDMDTLTRRCNGCHGDNGNSNNAATPTLAAQRADYLKHAMQAYATGQRPHQTMTDTVTQLTQAEIDALAHFYARQQREVINVRIPASATAIASKCDQCHGVNGKSERPDKPILAGQSERYLISALKDYQTEIRENSTMHAMTELLSELEIHTIARHYAQQK